MARILVIDDESTLVETLEYNLRREGHEVITASTGLEALEKARALAPNLIILDIMLPEMDGFEVCRRLRQEIDTPILMLTARDEEIDKVVGLELGADDYLTKPFSLRELLARVKATLRRVEMDTRAVGQRGASMASEETLSAGDVVVDLNRHETRRGQRLLTLKPKEYDLLVFFMRHRGQVLSRETLLERVWGYDYPGGTRTVDVHVRWLREKIEDQPSEPHRLLTVRNVGYKFEG
ncbi:MAG: response regulator transcription factor [Chloroflexota bacterium]